MKTDWEIKTLGEVCEKIENISWANFPKQEFKYIDLTSVSRDSFSVTNSINVNAKNAPSRAKKIVLMNDVIFGTTRPTLRRVAKIPKEFDRQLCSTGFAVLRPKKDKVISEFFFYFLQTDSFNKRTEKIQRGTSYPAVTDSDIKDTELNIPPLAEQKRIVKFLDEKFGLIEELKKVTEQQIVDAKELFESKLNEVFTNPPNKWTTSALKELTSKIGSGATPRGGEKAYKTEGISLIRSLNIYDNRFKYNKLAFLDTKQAEGLSNVSVESDDVLFNITGASIARCSTVPKGVLPARVNQHVSILRPIKNLLNSKFLMYLMISKVYKDKLLFTGNAAGSTRQAITKSQLENFIICYPPLSYQKQIVKKLEEISEQTKGLEAIYRKKITDLEELKKSYLEQAFSGKL